MKKRISLLLLICTLILLLTGCNMRTVYELYSLPKRSEAYTNLQSVIDSCMSGLEYSAPLTGEHQQTVQMADLSGNGVDEFILFAKGGSEKPLQMFIFSKDGDSYYLLDTIESNGTAFDQVEYVQIDDRPGMEIVVSRQVSDQVMRSVSVYSLRDGQIEKVMSDNCTSFLCTNFSDSKKNDLFILRPGASNSGNGVAVLYSFRDGSMQRSQEASMSVPVENMRYFLLGKIDNDFRASKKAVFVTSNSEGRIYTDIFCNTDEGLVNLAGPEGADTSTVMLGNYMLMTDDVDHDGLLELPRVINRISGPDAASEGQGIVCWYSVDSSGSEKEKMFTYHNMPGKWYLELSSELAPQITVEQQGSSFEFMIWNKQQDKEEKLLTIYVLTGQKREEQANSNNRFPVYKSESTVYAVKLEVAAAVYGMTKESITSNFHPVVQTWNPDRT